MSRSRLGLLLFVAVAATGLSPLSEAAVWYLPGVANAGGRNGTHFSSEVRVLNRGEKAAQLRFEFVPIGGASPDPVTRELAPGSTLAFYNVLRELWDLEGAGTLQITADQSLVLTGRTYNDATPPGTYGTALTAIPFESLLSGTTAADTGHIPWLSESPDSSLGYRTNLFVFLLGPPAQASVQVYAANGRDIAFVTLRPESYPASIQISLSSITPSSGVPMSDAAYALVNIIGGLGTAFASVVDNVTGDGIAVPALRAPLEPLDAVINGAARAPGREGTFFQTDVRILNPSTESAVEANRATITITPVSVAGVTDPVMVTLLPRNVTELKDVLGSKFSAPEGSTGALRLQSTRPMIVLARTSNVSRTGQPGTFSAFQEARPISEFLVPGSDAVLTGLQQTADQPGYRTNIGLLGGPEGALVRLSLLDRAGAVFATREDVTAGSNAWTQPSLGSLFANAVIPPESVLRVEPLSGAVDVYASVIDNVSGDATVSAAADYQSYSCLPPQIVGFTAEPVSPPEPGAVAVSWFAPGAATVRLEPEGLAPDNLQAAPQFPYYLRLPGGEARLTLTATGPCGTVTRTLDVAAGVPSVEPLAASAAPAQLVRLRVRAMPTIGAPPRVRIIFPDEYQAAADLYPAGAADEWQFAVPFLPDGGFSPPYRTGSVTLAVEAGGLTSAPVAFSIAPLAFSGDPAAALLEIIETDLSSLAPAADAGRDVPEIALAVGRARASYQGYLALFRKLASDLSASETATIAEDLPTADNPSPLHVTVTRADLALFIALYRNAKASGLALRSPQEQARGVAAMSTVAERYKLLEYCLTARVMDPDNFWPELVVNVRDVMKLDPKSPGVIVGQWAVTTLGNLLFSALQSFFAPCPFSPVWLRGFTLTPFQIRGPGDKAIKVNAYMESLVTSELLASTVTDALFDFVVGKFTKAMPKAYQNALEKVIKGLKDQTIRRYRDDVAAYLKDLGGVTNLAHTEQAGNGDIQSLDLTDEAGRPSQRGRFAKRNTPAGDGELDYHFEALPGENGKTPEGGVEEVTVTVNSTGFLFPGDFAQPYFKYRRALKRADREFKTQLLVDLELDKKKGKDLPLGLFSVNNVALGRYYDEGPPIVQRVLETQPLLMKRCPITSQGSCQGPGGLRLAGTGALVGNTLYAYTRDDRSFGVVVRGLNDGAGTADQDRGDYTVMSYRLTFDTRKGVATGTGSLNRARATVTRSVDGGTHTRLIGPDDRGGQSSALVFSDAFSPQFSYEQAGSHRLFGRGAAKGMSALSHVFATRNPAVE